MSEHLLLAFYGDDYTGSTDALESLSSSGVRTALFLEPPRPEDLTGRFSDLQAVGVAGRSRSMTPAEMDEELPAVFEAISDLEPTIFQYKVCSTFDSAPDRGSIGRAIDIGQDVFDSPFVPVVVGVPQMEPRGRYVVFGNLFATYNDGETYRLDRHPTMRDHPTTPMTESDLARHLADQTDRSTATVDILHLDGGPENAREVLQDAREDGEVVVFDTLTESHLETIGRTLWEYAATNGETTFGVGSSGFGYAFSKYWQDAGLVFNSLEEETAPPVDSLAVMSGSASPVTADQIRWALDHGYAGVRLDTTALIHPDEGEAECTDAIEVGVDAVAQNRGVVFYTARGPDDPAIEATREEADRLGLDHETIGRRIGQRQGRILREFLTRTDVDRVCIAGGDTSSYTTPALDVYALEMKAPLSRGSPLCRASSRSARFDGLELALKGGQIGDERYFERTRLGEPE